MSKLETTKNELAWLGLTAKTEEGFVKRKVLEDQRRELEDQRRELEEKISAFTEARKKALRIEQWTTVILEIVRDSGGTIVAANASWHDSEGNLDTSNWKSMEEVLGFLRKRFVR